LFSNIHHQIEVTENLRITCRTTWTLSPRRKTALRVIAA